MHKDGQGIERVLDKGAEERGGVAAETVTAEGEGE